MTVWKASDSTKGKYIGSIEFQSIDGKYHYFEIVEMPDRILFGGCVNTGFLESGYILKDKDMYNTDETLQEMLADLEVYYNDGPEYVSAIVCNERM